jgi:hypothetical protein
VTASTAAATDELSASTYLDSPFDSCSSTHSSTPFVDEQGSKL